MTNKQYQSEDMEMLLMQKEFSELLPEEKAFVLTHIEDEEEYTRMRNLLYQFIEIEKLPTDGPDESVKQALDALFEDHKPRSLFPFKTLLWGISGLAAIFILGYFIFQQSQSAQSEKLLAENNIPTEKKEIEDQEQENQLQKEQIEKPEQSIIPLTPPQVEMEIIEAADDVSENVETNDAPAQDEQLSIVADVATTMIKSPTASSEAPLLDFTALYPGGEAALKYDAQAIIQTHSIKKPETTEKKKNYAKSETSSSIFKILINNDGTIQDVQLVKGGGNDPNQQKIWCKALKKELKNFKLNDKGTGGTFYLPVNIALD
ncbi:MAG: hypothetical protein RL521_1450 [Bacteroidota bacterium]|jgi:hypothetical protein